MRSEPKEKGGVAINNRIIIKEDRAVFQNFEELTDEFYLNFYGEILSISNEPAAGAAPRFKIKKNKENEVLDKNVLQLLKAYDEEGRWYLDEKKMQYFFIKD